MMSINITKINLYNKLMSTINNNTYKNFKDLYAIMDNIININFRQKIKKSDKHEILVTQMNGCGDLILVSGALRELRNNYPNSNITLICLNVWENMLTNCPYINKLIPCYSRDDNLNVALATNIEFCFRNLWDTQYDMAINFHWGQVSILSSLLCWLSGAKERIGFAIDIEKRFFENNILPNKYFAANDNFNDILTKALINPPEIIKEVNKKYWLLEQIGCTIKNKDLEVWLDKDNIQIANNLLNTSNKKIIIGLGGSYMYKKYPVRKLFNVIQYIDKINKKDNIFIFTGGLDEVNDATYLATKCNKYNIKYLNLVNQYNMNIISAIISKSNIYIGNDTGTAHIAAAFKIPTITYIAESKDKENIKGKEVVSSYLRFAPYNNKSIVLRPEQALDECKDAIIHGGCLRLDSQHCISAIDERKIILAYLQLI